MFIKVKSSGQIFFLNLNSVKFFQPFQNAVIAFLLDGTTLPIEETMTIIEGKINESDQMYLP